MRFHHENLICNVDNFVCDAWQRHKLAGPGYGLLPTRDIKECPFDEVSMDLIGPLKIQVQGRPCEFFALTCIDSVTNLVELARIEEKSSAAREHKV